MAMVPLWLQKIRGGFNNFTNRLTGPVDPNLRAQENAARQQQARMAMAAQLLRSAAPRPQGTGNAISDFGTAVMAGQQAGNQFSADALRTKLMQLQLAQAQQGTADPSDIRAMQRLGYPLTPEGFAAYNAAQARPGTTINVGEAELDKPIPIAQLDTVRLPNGKTPPLGTTMRQAREMGAQVVSTAEQQKAQQGDAALGILGQLRDLAVGEHGVFTDVKAGLGNRAAGAVEAGIGMLTQDDPRVSRYNDMSQATLAPFIKFLGETGSLAKDDVTRAIGLLPRLFPLPDTKEVATQKLDALQEIIDRGVNNLKSGKKAQASSETAPTEQEPPPPPGYRLLPE